MSFSSQLKQPNEDLKILTRLIQAVHKSSDLEEIYSVALDSVIGLKNVDLVMIYLIEEEKREAVLTAHRNVPEDYRRRAGRIPYPKGITWKVINTGKIINIKDAQKDPDTGPAGRELGHHSNLGIPVFLEEKVIGVIWFGSYKERRFDAREVNLLSTLGNQIAIAIAKAKRTEEIKEAQKNLEERNRNLSILSAMSHTIHQSVGLNQIYATVLDVVKNLKFIDLISAYIVEGEGDNREAVLQIHNGYPEEYLNRASRIPYPKGNAWRVIESGESVFYEDASHPSTPVGPAGKALGQRSLLSIPIRSGTETIGVIDFSSFTRRLFSEQELDFLLALGNQVGMAIAKARIFEEIRQREEALRRSEERYRAIVEDQTELICRFLPDGTLTFINDSYCRYFAKKREELIGLRFVPWIPDQDQKRCKDHMSSLNLENPVTTLEHRVFMPSGEVRWHQWTERAIFDEKGNIVEFQAVGRDITERKRAEESLREKESRLEKHQHVLLELAKINTISDGKLKIALQKITEASAHTLGVERVSIWLYKEDRSKIACLDTYEKSLDCHSDGIEIAVVDAPNYFKAMEERNCIVAHDAQKDPNTKEFTDSYLSRFGITSMIDAPIRLGGQTVGVVCHEHVGPVRQWSVEEQSFVRAVADIVSLTLEQLQRRRAEEASLQRSHQLEILSHVNQEINTVLEIPIVMRTLIASAMELVEAEAGMAGLMVNEKLVFTEYNNKGDLISIDYIFEHGYGVPGWVMDIKKPYVCNDAENDPHVIPAIRKSLCFYNFINVPILNRRGELLGCFEVLNKRDHRPFDEGDVEILRGLAASAATALENAQMLVERKRAEESLQENLAQLSKKNRYENIISTVTRSVHRSINLQDVLENAVESINQNMDGVDKISIYLVECENSDELSRAEAVLKANRGLDSSYIERAGRVPYPKGATWKVIMEGEPRYCPDVDQDTILGPAGRDAGIKSYLSMPICFGSKTVGTINIISLKRNAFDEDELRLLKIVAQQIEIAINNAKQMEALKKSEEQQALILRSVPMATYVCRSSGDFGPTWMSENVVHIAGFPSRQFVEEEQLWVSRIHCDDRERVLTECGTIVDKGSIAIEYRWQCADGSYHWFLDQAVLVRDEQGNPKEIIGTWLDITDRKHAEQEVHTLNLQLEERVNERTAQLKAANEELLTAMEEADHANRAKSEFLSRMSHELRTPMNAILGFAQLLDMYPSITPERRENVKHILEAGRHLLNLINEVLDITRIDSGRLTVSMEQVRVKDVTEEALDLIQPIAAQRKIRLQSMLLNDWYILADRRRVKQVLLNLLSNAIKYNREGGLVELSCEEVPEKLLRIKVTDTGSGIPVEKIERLFNPFDRLGAEQGSIEGTGLGLALCKQLVGAMRGIIGVESAAGQGSSFWFEIPLVESPVEQLNDVDISSKVELEADGKGRTLLYIEDDPSSLRLIEQILVHRPGIKVLSAMQGSLGLDLAQETDPDLILLDLNLPDLTGEEVLCRLKEDPKTREIPVAIISANGVPGNIERFLTLGVQAYLTKPLDVEEFLNALDNVL